MKEADSSWTPLWAHMLESENSVQRWNRSYLLWPDNFKNTFYYKKDQNYSNLVCMLGGGVSGIITHRLFSLVGLSLHLVIDPFSQFSSKKKHNRSLFFCLWNGLWINSWIKQREFREQISRLHLLVSQVHRKNTSKWHLQGERNRHSQRASFILPLWNIPYLRRKRVAAAQFPCCFAVLMATTTRLWMRGCSPHAGGLYALAPGLPPAQCTGWQEAGTGQPNAEI